MMKSFILAATSISYILSIVNIADAGVQNTNPQLEQEVSCLNQASTETQTISTNDIRSICQVLTNYYAENNKKGMRIQANPNSSEKKIFAWEVMELKLVSYSKGKNGGKDLANIQIVQVQTDYLVSGAERTWLRNETNTQRLEVVFHKKNNKWNYVDQLLFHH